MAPHVGGVTEPMFSQLLRMALFNCLVFVFFALIGSLWEWGSQKAIVFGVPTPPNRNPQWELRSWGLRALLLWELHQLQEL